jgi:hypothetical protein
LLPSSYAAGSRLERAALGDRRRDRPPHRVVVVRADPPDDRLGVWQAGEFGPTQLQQPQRLIRAAHQAARQVDLPAADLGQALGHVLHALAALELVAGAAVAVELEVRAHAREELHER